LYFIQILFFLCCCNCKWISGLHFFFLSPLLLELKKVKCSFALFVVLCFFFTGMGAKLGFLILFRWICSTSMLCFFSFDLSVFLRVFRFLLILKQCDGWTIPWKRYGPYVWNRLHRRRFCFPLYLGSWKSINHGPPYESNFLTLHLCLSCTSYWFLLV